MGLNRGDGIYLICNNDCVNDMIIRMVITINLTILVIMELPALEVRGCISIYDNSHTSCICLTVRTLCVFKCLLKVSDWVDAYSHRLHLFGFSPLCCNYLNALHYSPVCVFKCFLKLLARADAKSHWLHLIVLSPLCVFKCLLKSPV